MKTWALTLLILTLATASVAADRAPAAVAEKPVAAAAPPKAEPNAEAADASGDAVANRWIYALFGAGALGSGWLLFRRLSKRG